MTRDWELISLHRLGLKSWAAVIREPYVSWRRATFLWRGKGGTPIAAITNAVLAKKGEEDGE